MAGDLRSRDDTQPQDLIGRWLAHHEPRADDGEVDQDDASPVATSPATPAPAPPAPPAPVARVVAPAVPFDPILGATVARPSNFGARRPSPAASDQPVNELDRQPPPGWEPVLLSSVRRKSEKKAARLTPAPADRPGRLTRLKSRLVDTPEPAPAALEETATVPITPPTPRPARTVPAPVPTPEPVATEPVVARSPEDILAAFTASRAKLVEPTPAPDPEPEPVAVVEPQTATVRTPPRRSLEEAIKEAVVAKLAEPEPGPEPQSQSQSQSEPQPDPEAAQEPVREPRRPRPRPVAKAEPDRPAPGRPAPDKPKRTEPKPETRKERTRPVTGDAARDLVAAKRSRPRPGGPVQARPAAAVRPEPVTAMASAARAAASTTTLEPSEARPRVEPGPTSAPRREEMPGEYRFKPRRTSRRILTLALLGGLGAAAYTGHAAYELRDSTHLGVAAICAAVTVLIWAIRAGGVVTTLTVRQGQLEVVKQGGRYVFDLANAYTPIEVHGRAGRRSWKVVFTRRGMTPFTIDASVVDPHDFMRVLTFFRPQLTQR